jgi:hypothetical protein
MTAGPYRGAGPETIFREVARLPRRQEPSQPGLHRLAVEGAWRQIWVEGKMTKARRFPSILPA